METAFMDSNGAPADPMESNERWSRTNSTNQIPTQPRVLSLDLNALVNGDDQTDQCGWVEVYKESSEDNGEVKAVVIGFRDKASTASYRMRPNEAAHLIKHTTQTPQSAIVLIPQVRWVRSSVGRLIGHDWMQDWT